MSIIDYQNRSLFGEDGDDREGRAAEHPLGVAFHGPWERDGDGFNEHVRRSARALALTGCPVHLRSMAAYISGTPRDMPKPIARLLQASISCYSAQVYQVVLSGQRASNLVAPRRGMTPAETAAVNARRVVYSVWERTSVDDATVRALNQVGQVWTACQANADMLRTSGVSPEKIRVFPVSYFPDDPLLALRGRTRKPGVPRFYHIGKWEPRKAQDQILLAFMRAFRPGEAHLILKTMTLTKPIDGYTQGPASEVSRILETDAAVRRMGWDDCASAQHIEIVTKFLTAQEILALHRFGDVYVSLSRAEGFGMPAFDAKLAGNSMVYTPSGGLEDFADSRDVQVPLTGTMPCHSFYRWLEARYFDFDVDAAAHAMRTAAARVTRNATWPDVLDERFQAKRVGEGMLEALQQLTGGRTF